MHRFLPTQAVLALLLFLSLNNASTFDLGSAQCTLKRSASKNCGIRGRADPNEIASIYAPQFVSSLEHCADLCARRRRIGALNQAYTGYYEIPYCASFGYTNSIKLCQLFDSQQISDNIIPRMNGNHIYYDIDCFKCAPICHQPYGTQLIDNGDFEQKLFGPWYTLNSNIRKGHNSPRAYHCRGNLTNQRNCDLRQTFNACQNGSAIYRYKFDYVVTIPEKMPAKFRFSSGDVTFVRETINTDPNAWRTAILYDRPAIFHPKGEYEGRAGGRMSFESVSPRFDLSYGDIYVDNVHVSRVPGAPRLVQPRNSIIENGGFESDGFSPWTVSPAARFQIVSPGINSSHALSFQIKDFHYRGRLTQKVVTKANTAYLFSFDVRAMSEDPWDLNVHFEAPSGSTGVFRSLPNHKNQSFSYPVYVKDATLNLTISARSATNEGVFIWDNFKMIEINQPDYFP